jgi:hypothetical protein
MAYSFDLRLASQDSEEESCRTTISTKNQLAEALKELVVAKEEKLALLSAGQVPRKS